jgi:hypothetical protein
MEAGKEARVGAGGLAPRRSPSLAKNGEKWGSRVGSPYHHHRVGSPYHHHRVGPCSVPRDDSCIYRFTIY